MSSSMLLRIISVVILTVILTPLVHADIPLLINYQGRLTDSGGDPVADGTYDITFSIYRSDDVQVWTSGPQPVPVTGGTFSYILGSSVELPSNVMARNHPRFLGIKVGTDAELVPRTQLISVPYAYHSLSSDTTQNVKENSVTSAQIVDESISSIDIAPDADIEVTKIMGTAVDATSAQTITGAKTFDDLNISTVTRRLSLSQAAFVPKYDTTSYAREGGYIKNTAYGSKTYYAPVSLPDGAIVTQFEATFYDTDPTAIGTITLSRFSPADTSWDWLTTTATGGQSGLITLTMNSINYATIDNENYFYMIAVVLRYYSSSTPDDMRFYGAEIEYTITKPLP